MSWNFQVVSMCMNGNGTRAGANALIASRASTELSLPIEYSITGFSNSAATSRMMWMLSASSWRRCVSRCFGKVWVVIGLGARAR